MCTRAHTPLVATPSGDGRPGCWVVAHADGLIWVGADGGAMVGAQMPTCSWSWWSPGVMDHLGGNMAAGGRDGGRLQGSR